jgi:hypothetical protein
MLLLGMLVLATVSRCSEGSILPETELLTPESTVFRSRFLISGEMAIFANRAKVANSETNDFEGVLLLDDRVLKPTPYGLDFITSAVFIRNDRSIQEFSCAVNSPERGPGMQFKKVTCFKAKEKLF